MTRRMDHFDPEQREGGRQALLEYMGRHKIGTPALLARINASEGVKKGVPLKTLQRFLANNGQTNDLAVSIFMRFAERCNASDVIREVGRSMSAFYGSKRSQDFSGRYEGLRYNHNMTLHIREGDRYWRLRAKLDGHDHKVLQGVMIDIDGGAALAMCKDMLTRLPASFVVHSAQGRLFGNGFSLPGPKAPPGETTWLPHDERFSLSKVSADD